MSIVHCSDTWVLGQYDTCTFYTEDGRQAFGVCCIDPPKLSEKPVVAPVVQDDENIILANKDTSISQWPPGNKFHKVDAFPSLCKRIKSS